MKIYAVEEGGRKSSLKEKSDSGSVDDFFAETSLHGWKYTRSNSKASKLIWILVLISSIGFTYLFVDQTLVQYINSPISISVNSTNQPLYLNDFPILTFCNINVLSKAKVKELGYDQPKTYNEAKKFAQPCDRMIRSCSLNNRSCEDQFTTVLTDVGWCCQIDISHLNLTFMDLFPFVGTLQGLQIMFDVQTYDYHLPTWYSEGILVVAHRRNSFAELLSKATFLKPGTDGFVYIKVAKTVISEAAIAKDSKVRNCLMPNEMDLKFFKEYTQENCYIDKVIEDVEKLCGCRGAYRGDKEPNPEVPECTMNGSLSWMQPMEYEECQSKGMTLREVYSAPGCPSQCLVNCEDYTVSLELSTATTPGFSAMCGDRGSLVGKVACLYTYWGPNIIEQVCPQRSVMVSEEECEHKEKLDHLCDPQFERLFNACSVHINDDARLAECLNESATIEELIAVKKSLYTYVRDNSITASFAFKERYYTSLKRDITYTWEALVANIGGLLGLCLGCSLISIFEIIFFCLKKIPCRLPCNS